MLVLSRKESEAIRIGDSIQVVVLGIRGSNVKIGIDCPREVAVHRQEIYAQLHAEASLDDESESDTETNADVETSPAESLTHVA